MEGWPFGDELDVRVLAGRRKEGRKERGERERGQRGGREAHIAETPPIHLLLPPNPAMVVVSTVLVTGSTINTELLL